MRLRFAALLLSCALATIAAAAGQNDVLVGVMGSGAVIRVPGAHLSDCSLVPSQPPRVVMAVAHSHLQTRSIPTRSTWLRSVRVLGPDVLGGDESRVVVEVASSLLQPHLEAAGGGVALVLSTEAPAAPEPPAQVEPSEPEQAEAEAPPPPAARSRPPVRAHASSDRERRARPAPEPEEDQEPPAPSRPAPRRQPWRNDVPGMATVAGGEVVVGSVEGTSFADEAPPHVVRLHAFRIDAREITVAEFAASPLPMPRQPEWSDSDDDPVVNVTWHEADEYCRWVDKRLPTESEWERAARGTDGRTYPWGDEWNVSLANSGMDGDGFEHLAPVGSFEDGASPEGALDMSGNAWEWTGDWYAADAYSRARELEPDGPGRGSHKVARGGSFRSRFSTSMTTTVRMPLPPSARRDDVGFRCAKSE